MIDREAARIVIVILTLGALIMVYAHLLGKHYYRLTYAACSSGSRVPLCDTWRQEAIAEGLVVLLVAAAAWIYNLRRK